MVAIIKHIVRFCIAISNEWTFGNSIIKGMIQSQTMKRFMSNSRCIMSVGETSIFFSKKSISSNSFYSYVKKEEFIVAIVFCTQLFFHRFLQRYSHLFCFAIIKPIFCLSLLILNLCPVCLGKLLISTIKIYFFYTI